MMVQFSMLGSSSGNFSCRNSSCQSLSCLNQTDPWQVLLQHSSIILMNWSAGGVESSVIGDGGINRNNGVSLRLSDDTPLHSLHALLEVVSGTCDT